MNLTKVEFRPTVSFETIHLSELTAHITKQYHDDLRKRVPDLLTLANKHFRFQRYLQK